MSHAILCPGRDPDAPPPFGGPCTCGAARPRADRDRIVCATFSGETGHYRIFRRLCHEAGLAPFNRPRLTKNAVQTRRGCAALVTCTECRVILDRWEEETGYQKPATVRRMRPMLRWFREMARK